MFKKSLDSIIKPLTKTLNELNAFVDQSRAKIEDNHGTIDKLSQENARISIEADRANSIVLKIAKLLD